ncbi:MAG: ASPIC/UnbV domain-containing protein [Pirellulaceae bacterium]
MCAQFAAKAIFRKPPNACHIGLGTAAELEAVSIRWPDGSTETINGLQTSTIKLRKGGEGSELATPRKTTISTAEIRANLAEPRESLRRIVPHRRLPMPKLDYVDATGERQFVNANAPTLVVVWATWCVPCLEEIKTFAQHQAELSRLGVEVSLLSVDEWDPADPDSFQLPFVALKKIGQFLNQGVATDATKTKLDLVQNNLLSRHRPLAIPASFCYWTPDA